MATKTKARDRITPLLAPFGFPSPPGPGSCFRPEDDRLLAQGYPFLHFLTDEAAPRDVVKAACDALDAIDPVLRVRVPRSLARAYLLGYSLGPNLFPRRPRAAQARAERDALIRSSREPDLALLVATLHAVPGNAGDTYGSWRYGEVLFLYESFVGADLVAETVVTYLVDALGKYGDATGPSSEERFWDEQRHVGEALGWVLRRTSPDTTGRLRARLARAAEQPPDPAGPGSYQDFHRLVAWLGSPGHRAFDGPAALTSRFIGDDAPFLRARLERLGGVFEEPARLVWVLGSAHLALPLSVAGRDLPALVDQLGVFRDPGVVRVFAHVATQRAGAAAVGEWFQRHADYARPIVQALLTLDDAREQKAAKAALALLDAATPPPKEPPAPLTEAQVEAAIATIFADLGAKLRKRSTKATRKAHIREAHERYTEACAAGGAVSPDAHFTHRFGDFDLGEFAMLAVEALEE